MKTKFHRYTLKGARSIEDAGRAVAETGDEGVIVRIDNLKGETHVYVAAASEKSPEPSGTKDKKPTKTLKRIAVSERDVTRLS